MLRKHRTDEFSHLFLFPETCYEKSEFFFLLHERCWLIMLSATRNMMNMRGELYITREKREPSSFLNRESPPPDIFHFSWHAAIMLFEHVWIIYPGCCHVAIHLFESTAQNVAAAATVPFQAIIFYHPFSHAIIISQSSLFIVVVFHVESLRVFLPSFFFLSFLPFCCCYEMTEPYFLPTFHLILLLLFVGVTPVSSLHDINEQERERRHATEDKTAERRQPLLHVAKQPAEGRESYQTHGSIQSHPSTPWE